MRLAATEKEETVAWQWRRDEESCGDGVLRTGACGWEERWMDKVGSVLMVLTVQLGSYISSFFSFSMVIYKCVKRLGAPRLTYGVFGLRNELVHHLHIPCFFGLWNGMS
jgi:hypothetical protein